MESNNPNALSAPRPPARKAPAAKPQRPSLLARLGLGGGAKLDPAEKLREEIRAKLPVTDPLRRARVQAHLFAANMPSFHAPESEQPSAPVVAAETKSGAKAESPTRANNKTSQPSPAPRSAKPETPTANASLAALRAERAQRADAAAQARADRQASPGVRRVDALRQAARPASSPTASAATGRHSSAQVKAAATRSPARATLARSQGTAASAARFGSRPGKSRGGLGPLLLLVMLLTIAILVALIWGAFVLVRNLSADDGTVAAPVDANLFDPIETSITEPSTSTPETTFTLTTEPVEPGPELTETLVPGPSEAELAESRRRSLVLQMKTWLFQKTWFNGLNFNPEPSYDLDTSLALRAALETFNFDAALVSEIRAAGLEPTNEQLERWMSGLIVLLGE